MSSEFYAGDCNHVCGACQRPGHTRAECPATGSSGGMHGRLIAGAGGSGPNSPMVTRIAALEAENERLSQGSKLLIDDLERRDATIEALRAQLAAIQGGMGEVVEVVARLMHWKGRHQNPWKVVARTYSECASYAYPKDWEEGAQLMTVAQHQRITAAMAAEVADAKSARDAYGQNAIDLQKQRDALRAELAEVKGREAVAWLPIETAPCDGRMALVYRPLARNSQDEPVAVKRLIGGNNHCWESTVPDGATPTNPTDGGCHVTHWMPFPQPPETALSTWRQAHTPSTLPASSAEE